jgi:transcriptional regulator with XRE-family HTH domain
MDSLNEVLEKVVQLQHSKGYTDEQMAAKIGCSRPLYQRTRTGKVPVGGTFLRGAMKLTASETDNKRSAVIHRETSETSINLELNIDGTGKYEVSTGINMFDHLLSQLARHGVLLLTRWRRRGVSCAWPMPSYRWMKPWLPLPWISAGGAMPSWIYPSAAMICSASPQTLSGTSWSRSPLSRG